MEDSYLTQHWLFTLLEREILSQFGCINESYQFVLQPNYIIVANINSVSTGKGLALSNPCSLIWTVFCFLSVSFYQWSWKRNTPIQTWSKTWPLPIFLGEVGDRFAASCSRVCPARCLPEGEKGRPASRWPLGRLLGRWVGGRQGRSGASWPGRPAACGQNQSSDWQRRLKAWVGGQIDGGIAQLKVWTLTYLQYGHQDWKLRAVVVAFLPEASDGKLGLELATGTPTTRSWWV